MTIETAADADPARPVVLVVDDQADVLEMVRLALSRAGFAVVTAQSARAGLDLVRTAPPDAIVLDLGMPQMDGWAFRAAQRALPGAAGVPVVLFTGNADVAPPSPDLAPAAVVRKPAGLSALVGAVRRVLPREG